VLQALQRMGSENDEHEREIETEIET
jgi:hypothetical protein